jgi:hypothetical protein
MAKIVLLTPMAGDNFHVSAGDVCIVSDEQKAQWIDGGIARDLLSTEPTELQTMRAKDFTLPALEKTQSAPQPETVEQNAQPKPSKRKKLDAV